MNKEYTPTTEEVLRYIRQSHREYLRAVEKNYQEWLKENPPMKKKKPKPKPKPKPIKTHGETVVDFEN